MSKLAFICNKCRSKNDIGLDDGHCPGGCPEAMETFPADIEQAAAHLAARLQLRTQAGKQDLIAAALQAERKQNQEAAEIERANFMEAVDDAAKNAFEMGEFAERLRALDLVKAWGGGLNGSEYLSRSIGLLFEQIKGGLPNPAVSVLDALKEMVRVFGHGDLSGTETDAINEAKKAVASWEAAGKPRKAGTE